MKILVILGHPHKGSFNHAIAHTAIEALKSNGHEVVFHDLYEEGFDPVIRYEEIPRDGEIDSVIKTHCEQVADADGIIVVHPNWWGQPPAILKGWIDRVIRPGVAYKFEENDSGEGVPIGLLKAKAAIVFNTSNTFHDREMRVFGDPLETIWKNCIFGLCGVNNFYRKMYGVIVTSTLEERQKWLDDVKEVVNRFFPCA
ncbi:NAD(P)H-dependent oxidoreductase [Acetivibrio straminisolvens]|jgi:putative NADPH-quinone reductase|uniref:NAD(P)H oxidoreductase YRKL n=1 Tax=Acetivibrio straminisolvens JCM 21531 TaxID=1294263 RepID=W4V3H2_9FIRM|nr:NAD(P)H-dependent oxidoreductase [Acetivibrio straminisolvens]GAE87985.1 NAD(P)H oxidoreductase YRKL [Acetivibrio straminisolvens JCM 21531]